MAPLTSTGALNTMIVEDTELGATKVPPTLSKVSEERPVEKLLPVSETVCEPVLVTEVGVIEEIVGAGKYVTS